MRSNGLEFHLDPRQLAAEEHRISPAATAGNPHLFATDPRHKDSSSPSTAKRPGSGRRSGPAASLRSLLDIEAVRLHASCLRAEIYLSSTAAIACLPVHTSSSPTAHVNERPHPGGHHHQTDHLSVSSASERRGLKAALEAASTELSACISCASNARWSGRRDQLSARSRLDDTNETTAVESPAFDLIARDPGRNPEVQLQPPRRTTPMDAFVQRSPRLLFRRDALLLWRGLDALRALVAEHGGRVLDESQAGEPLAGADGARELLLVVPDGAGDAAVAAELRAARLRFPRARVVAAEWVRACVAQSKRLPTRAFEAADEVEPPAKRARTAVDLLVGAPAAAGREERPQPHFRPWQSLDGGSLLVLDARARADEDEDDQASKSKNVKVAAFDLDGTLIVTKSGKRFAQNDNDWKWFHPTRVTEKLAELVADGFDLVLFSNQNGVEKGKVTAAEVQRKVLTIVKKLDLPMLVFLATRDDMNRKPRVNAWTKMAEMLKSEGEIDKSSSFYCGDAAGRPKIAGRNKDFAATDYKFALNVGVSFLTPEALFLASKQRVHTHPDTWEIGFDPRSIPIGNGPLLNPAASDLTREHQEMVLLAGSPASGKSHFAASCFSSYVVVNQDDLRTVANCKKVCLEALANKKSVVIDGTNRSKPTRKEWIDIAQSHNLPVRCFEMDVPKTVTMYLNVFRSLTTSKKIPDVAIHGFYKNYTAPEVSEGFEEIVKVSFQLDKASLSDESFRLIRSFL